MYFIWILLGFVLISLLYAAFRVLKDEKQRLPKCVFPLPSTSLPSASAAFFLLNIGREVKWITTEELQRLKGRSDDLVVIDCRSGDRRRIPAIAGSQAVSIKPAQLSEILNWLPANQSAVLCGVSDLCPSATTNRPHRRGLAPLYVLKDDPFRLGAGLSASSVIRFGERDAS